MDSTDFFQNHRKEWVGKQGIYVIENELFSKHLGKRIFKVGYARYDMAGRIADYRTAYSPLIPFKIHLLYEVPERVRGKRANFAKLTETRIHNTLKKRRGIWTGAGEWHYDLDTIINVIYSIRLEHKKTVPNMISDKWVYYSPHKAKRVVQVDSEDNVSSKLKDIIVMTQEELDRRKRTSTKNIDLRDKERITRRTDRLDAK